MLRRRLLLLMWGDPNSQTPMSAILIPCGSSISSLFSVAAFGARGDARKVTDAAATSGSTTVTSATAAFTAADVGKTVWAVSVLGVVRLAQTTIAAVNSATSITTTVAAASTGTALHLVLGTDDTAALQAASAAAVAAPVAGAVRVPAGGYVYTSARPFNFGMAVSGSPGPSLIGEGSESTVFFPSPSMAAGSGTLLCTISNCDNSRIADFSVDGCYSTFGGNQYHGLNMYGRNTKVTGVTFRRCGLINAPFSMGGGQAVFIDCHAEFTGTGRGFLVSGASASMYGCYSGNNASNSLYVTSGSCEWFGGTLDEVGASLPSVNLDGTSVVRLIGVREIYAGGTTTAVTVGGTAVLHAVSCNMGPYTGRPNCSGLTVGATAAAYLVGCSLTSSGTGSGLVNAGNVYDGGNNVASSKTGAGSISIPAL